MTILVSSPRSPRATARRARAPRPHRVAGHDGAHRAHDPAGRAADSRPRRLRQDAARSHRGAGPFPGCGATATAPVWLETRTHRARAAPLPEGPSPRFGGASSTPWAWGRREPGSREARALAQKRSQQPRGPGVVRLAADPRPLDRGGVRRHRRRPAGAALGRTPPACRGSRARSASSPRGPDLTRAAELRPGLYREYAALERRIGHTLSPARIPCPS